MLHKAKIFVFDAGKIIMIISLVLWGLSTYGPSEKMKAVADKYNSRIVQNPLQKDQLTRDKNAALLEQSFAGIIGRSIEPIIKPLGYDWKIGIALVTSFAAREVFVGTMATLYSVEGGAEAEESTLTEKMKSAKRTNGEQLYTLSTGISLLIFYALAMQCMSTIAIVKRETKSWKWPLIQLGYMTGLAYVLSWLGFIVFS
jgi:ferrous iron transport protein B